MRIYFAIVIFVWSYRSNAQSIIFEITPINFTKGDIEKELAKYPKNILEDNLKKVVVVSTDEYCGMSYPYSKIELSGDCANCGEIGITIHHELSSMFLFQNLEKNEMLQMWEAFNNLNGPYSYTGLDKNQLILSGSELADYFYKSTYAMHSFENDFNIIAENLFANGYETIQFIKERSNLPVSKKIKIVLEFYQKLSPTFTVSYFEKQKI